MSAPYNCYNDMRVTMAIDILIQSFLFKLDELDICKPPCPIAWREILEAEAKASQSDEDDFERTRAWMFEHGLLQK